MFKTGKPFIIRTDANNYAIGAALLQLYGHNLHSNLFESIKVPKPIKRQHEIVRETTTQKVYMSEFKYYGPEWQCPNYLKKIFQDSYTRSIFREKTAKRHVLLHLLALIALIGCLLVYAMPQRYFKA